MARPLQCLRIDRSLRDRFLFLDKERELLGIEFRSLLLRHRNELVMLPPQKCIEGVSAQNTPGGLHSRTASLYFNDVLLLQVRETMD